MSDSETPDTRPPPAPASRTPRKWLRRTVALLVVLAVLVAAGFAALPSLIKSQLPKYVASHYKRTASLGDISINPFKLRVEIHDFNLAEADGRAIAGFAALVADLEWSSITLRAWHLAEVRLSEPKALLDIAPDGRINLAELIADLTRDSPKDETSTLPRVVIDAFVIEKGHADFSDRRAGYSNTLAPIDLRFGRLSTLPEDRGPYTFSAKTARGGSLHWKGEISLNPLAADGVISGEALSLPELSVYLKPFVAAEISSGKAGFSLPFHAAYRDGRLAAGVDGAALGVEALALKAEGGAEPFLALQSFRAAGLKADYAKREVELGEVALDGGKAAVKRNAAGQIDLLALLRAPATPATAVAAAAESRPAPAGGGTPTANGWKLKIGKISLDHFALAYQDLTAPKPLAASIAQVTAGAGVDVETGAANRFALSGLTLGLHEVRVNSGGTLPLRVAEVSLTGGEVDLAARSASIAQIGLSDGQITIRRDRQGRINLLDLVPGSGSAKAPAQAAGAQPNPWRAKVAALTLDKFTADLSDEDSGIALQAQQIGVKLSDVSSDLNQPLKFDAGLSLREGGKLSASGKAIPAQSSMEASVAVERLALKPVQPLLAHYLKLKLAHGSVSAKGDLAIARPGGKTPALRYSGSLDVAELRLDEENAVQFAAWKNVGADRLTLTLQPDRLEIPELRVAGLQAKLLIEADHSLNASRLLVHRPAAGESTAMFPVVVRRTRVQNATLEFSDLSLRPPFSAKIHELGGVVNGLSTNKRTRSQIELDGRVDEFGSARIRGELNPFAPLNNTDVALVFKNVDMVSASPYAMKFAGYRIASGKISLDLNYKFRDGKLEGRNNVVFDKLTLGEKVESPEAMDLPLELALAILTDSDGKIDLDLPVSGDLNNPQFSYGAVIWKAVTSLIGRIVTAPFRALGALFGGGSGDNLDTIDFDPGRANLLPPEREKLKKVATMLSKRAQLKLSVPGSYNQDADSQALKVRAARLEIARRAGIKQAEGEEPGPPDLQDRAVQQALRALLAEREGEPSWFKRKAEAEQAAGAAHAEITVLQRARRLTRGEPQVADITPFYRSIAERLVQTQPLPPEALQSLARRRADTVVDFMKASGVDPGRLAQPATGSTRAGSGKSVPLKLELSAR